MFSNALIAQAHALQDKALAVGWRIACAESCTGGLIAALLTTTPGSSSVFEHGFITYSNAAKTELLGVPTALLDADGAVSAPVAEAMATGALRRLPVNIAVAATGIAGPDGGSTQKPVGLVFLAVATLQRVQSWKYFFTGTRDQIRMEAVEQAIVRLAGQVPSARGTL